MLEITKLSFAFRHRRLFHDLSLQAGAGELVHVAGPNGAGKSTLLAIIAGLLPPASGSITYRSSAGLVDDRRHYLEYLPAEANGLYLKLGATQNLQFWARLRGAELSTAAAWAALAPWNLNHPLLRDNFAVDKFSTGMKRRLALARLLLSPATGWLLDEPVYGLDTQAMAIFTAMLAGHLAAGGFALMVSHDLAPFQALITKTVVIGAPPSAAAGAS